MRKHWRCFHCDEVFTDRAEAALHFGADASAEPACKLASHEGHILTALRKAQAELERYRSDDSDLMRSILALEAAKAKSERTAEETGYARAVKDMMAQGHCPEPALHAEASA